uniref:Uncharacterized protein n=1 Tax=Anguilla anguilla TaxID=7936 RepID=A0A0E9RUG0_ANGAN
MPFVKKHYTNSLFCQVSLEKEISNLSETNLVK